jgi:hypothetical protein
MVRMMSRLSLRYETGNTACAPEPRSLLMSGVASVMPSG